MTGCDDVTRDYLITPDMLLCSQEVILTFIKDYIDLKTNPNRKIVITSVK